MNKLLSILSIFLVLAPSLQGFAAPAPFPDKGGAYINAIDNGGFENGLVYFTASGGSFTLNTSTPANGKASATWAPSAINQTLSTKAYAIPEGLKGRNCLGKILYKTAEVSNPYTLLATDGSDNALASTQLVSSASYSEGYVTFICPSSGSLKLKVVASSGGVPASISTDDWHEGSNYLIADISQAQFVGSSRFALNPSCLWSRNNTALGSFSTNVNCNGPTIEVQNEGSWLTTDVDLPKQTINNLPPGNYRVEATMTVGSDTPADSVGFAISDGTDVRGSTLIGVSAATNTVQHSVTVIAWFSYATAGNHTFEIFGASASGSAIIVNEGATQFVRFNVYQFPLTPSASYRVDSGGLSAGDAVTTFSSSCPTGTIPADGSSQLRSAYPALFAAISTDYGSADGTHFNLPNGQGVFIRGSGSQTIAGIVYTGTRGTTQGDQLQGHFHMTARSGSNVTYGITNATVSAGATGIFAQAGGADSAGVGAATDDGTDGTPRVGSETRPANISAKICIRTVPATAAPVVINSVTSNTSGAERIERVMIAGGNPPTITSQSGNWISFASRTGTGDYTFNFSDGIFSATPTCTCTANGSRDRICSIISKNTAAIRTNVSNGAGTDIDEGRDYVCMGPR